jgi:hypothetical protein
MALRDHQTIILDPQLNAILEAALFENWLGDSDASRIANAHKFHLHRRLMPHFYIVITETPFCRRYLLRTRVAFS